ncbi:MAG: hypothetical protein PVJ33_12990 [Lysobacterales bacterium]|jgi:hypothetical protein
MKVKHRCSPEDEAFAEAFERCRVAATDFGHEAHVRLAYVYLCGQSPEDAHQAMKAALLAFLDHLAVGRSKYHETMTHAWIMAISHFMDRSAPCADFAEFSQRNPELLDPAIMLTHYSGRTLFSDEARNRVIEPDIDPIPR